LRWILLGFLSTELNYRAKGKTPNGFSGALRAFSTVAPALQFFVEFSRGIMPWMLVFSLFSLGMFIVERYHR
jgi:hypothetical protein